MTPQEVEIVFWSLAATATIGMIMLRCYRAGQQKARDEAKEIMPTLYDIIDNSDKYKSVKIILKEYIDAYDDFISKQWLPGESKETHDACQRLELARHALRVAANS